MLLSSEVGCIMPGKHSVVVLLKDGATLYRKSAVFLRVKGRSFVKMGVPVYPDTRRVWVSLSDGE